MDQGFSTKDHFSSSPGWQDQQHLAKCRYFTTARQLQAWIQQEDNKKCYFSEIHHGPITSVAFRLPPEMNCAITSRQVSGIFQALCLLLESFATDPDVDLML